MARKLMGSIYPQGTVGPRGPQGIQGPEGPQGPKGDAFTYEDFTPEQLEALTGPQGEEGPTGQDGANGVTFTPSVSNEGIISWTNDGDLPNPQSVNIKGPKGDDGQDGADGQDGQDGTAATITVGTVTTGAAGSNASVANVGTSSAAVFNFTIPRGNTGATGPAGTYTAGTGIDITSDIISSKVSFSYNSNTGVLSITDSGAL